MKHRQESESMDYELRCEAFLEELLREYYGASAGLKDRLEIAPIYQRYRELFDRETVDGLLGRRDGKTSQFLAENAVDLYLSDQVKELSESITNRLLQARISWDGQEVPYMNLAVLIANEPDKGRRHDLERRRRGASAAENPAREERFGRLHRLAVDVGFEDYVRYCDELKGLRLGWLSQQMARLLAATEDAYLGGLDQALAGLGVERAEAMNCDMSRLHRAPQHDRLFPAERLLESLRRTAAGLGIDLDEVNGLRLDTEPRPLKSPRAFCAPIRVPYEVMLVIKPKGGQDDFRALFHEAGHALHFSLTAESAPFAYRRLGDNSLTECYAFLFDHLVRNPHWLKRIMGIDDSAGFVRLSRFLKVYMLRRYASKLLYEQRLHRGLAGAQADYVATVGGNVRLDVGAENYLDDVDDGFYCAQYLRAWILEAQVSACLEERFGVRWFAEPGAGRLLRELWATGTEYTAEDLAAELGYEGLDAEPLIGELTHGG